MIKRFKLYKSTKTILLGYIDGDSIRGIVLSSSSYSFGYKGKWNKKAFIEIPNINSDIIPYSIMGLFDISYGIAKLPEKK